MAIELKKGGEAAQVAPTGKMDLVLGAHERYVFGGVVYEKGKVYSLPEPAAQSLLKHRTDGGMPVFNRHVPKIRRKVERTDEGLERVDMTGAEVQEQQVSDRPVVDLGAGDDDAELNAHLGRAGSEEDVEV